MYNPRIMNWIGKERCYERKQEKVKVKFTVNQRRNGISQGFLIFFLNIRSWQSNKFQQITAPKLVLLIQIELFSLDFESLDFLASFSATLKPPLYSLHNDLFHTLECLMHSSRRRNLSSEVIKTEYQ